MRSRDPWSRQSAAISFSGKTDTDTGKRIVTAGSDSIFRKDWIPLSEVTDTKKRKVTAGSDSIIGKD